MSLTPITGPRAVLPTWPSQVATVEEAVAAVLAMLAAADLLAAHYAAQGEALAGLDPHQASGGWEALACLTRALEDLPAAARSLLPAIAPPQPAHQLLTISAGAELDAPVVPPSPAAGTPRREWLVGGPLLSDPTVLDNENRPGPSRWGVTTSEARLSILAALADGDSSAKLRGRRLLLPAPVPPSALHTVQVAGRQLVEVGQAATTAAVFAADPARPGGAQRSLRREADAYAELYAGLVAAAPGVLTAQSFGPLAAAQTTATAAVSGRRTITRGGPSWA